MIFNALPLHYLFLVKTYIAIACNIRKQKKIPFRYFQLNILSSLYLPLFTCILVNNKYAKYKQLLITFLSEDYQELRIYCFRQKLQNIH